MTLILSFRMLNIADVILDYAVILYHSIPIKEKGEKNKSQILNG